MLKFKETLEEEVKENSLTIDILLEILKLEKLSDDEILEKYKYKKWKELDRNIVKYLEYKYYVLPFCPFSRLFYPSYYENECFGETYERLQKIKEESKEEQNKTAIEVLK